MFAPLRPAGNRSLRLSLAISLVLHCLGLAWFLRPTPGRFITPLSILAGNYGTAVMLVYPRQGTPEITAGPKPRTRPPARLKFPNTQLDQASLAPSVQPTPEGANAPATGAGSPFGSLSDGPTTGHDIRPALPVIAPDPVVAVSDLPADLDGNVIVEVTIDAQGNVIRTRVLQALGHGIEEKVLAALRNWHFTPATEDGIAIASQHDVYFHFGRRQGTNR